MAWTLVTYEKANNIARITLNRPDKRNAQNTPMLDELDQAMNEAERDPEVRVIILGAAGPSFSAGHDLKAAIEEAQERTAKYGTGLEGLYRYEQDMFLDKCLIIRNLSKPTIAQVHGHCVAAGLMLACMCDLIVASEDAEFSDPVVRMTAAAVELLVHPWEMGARRAKEFLFTGDPMSAHEAQRLGMVNRVVPRERLEEEVNALATKIAAMPPVALRLVKRSINRTLDRMGQRDSWEEHFIAHMLSHGSEEWRIFTEKRYQAQEQGGMKAFVAMRDKDLK